MDAKKSFRDIIDDKFNYIYVPEDSKNLQLLYRVKEEEEIIKWANISKHNEKVSECDKIINSAAKLIRELGLNDSPTSYFTIFLYLLWNGVFSKDMKYMYGVENLRNIKHLYRLDVMYGCGNCKVNSDMLKEVFKSLGYKAYFLINSTTLHYVDYRLDNNIFSEKNTLMGARYYDTDCDDVNILSGNHADVLLEKDGNYYVFDPTNMLIFKLDSMFTADLYNGIGKCYIKPWGFIFFEHRDQSMILNLLDKIKEQDISKFLTNDEIRDITIDAINRCHKAKTLILDYREEIKPSINKIVNC